MRQIIVKRSLLLACCCLLCSAAAILSGSLLPIAAAAALLILCIGSLLLGIGIRKKVAVRLEMPATAGKLDAVVGKLTAASASRLPGGPLLCRLRVSNQLTGESKTVCVQLAVPPRGESCAEFRVQSPHCGYLQVRAEGLYITDWLGLLPVRLEQKVTAGCTVVPDTFIPEIEIDLSRVTPENEEEYAPDKAGQDYTETFQIRDYREGDSIKQLHWKLSEKLDRPVVRDPGLPVSRSLLLLWDKSAAACGPEETDALAEVTASVAQALTDQGINYTLGCHDDAGFTFTEVESREELLQSIPNLLRYGAGETAEQTVEEYFPQGFPYAKTLYFAGAVSHVPYAEKDGSVTALLCASNLPDSSSILHFEVENYAEDLHTILL